MKLVAYLRVSSVNDDDHGASLAAQRDAIGRWAKEHGHKVRLWTEDAGISGANGLDTRDGLPEAIGALKSGDVEGLVVYRLDRLARDLVLQETLLAEAHRLGGQVFSTVPGESEYLVDDPDDPSRKLIRQVLGAVQEYERSVIAMRLRAGKRRKAATGGWTGGRSPFGWRAEHGELVPVPEEQETIAMARHLRDGGASLREIGRELVAEGRRPRNGREWNPTQIVRLLDEDRHANV